VGYDVTSHVCALESIRFLLTYKNYYGILPAAGTMKAEAAYALFVACLTIQADAGMTRTLRQEAPASARARSHDAAEDEDGADETI